MSHSVRPVCLLLILVLTTISGVSSASTTSFGSVEISNLMIGAPSGSQLTLGTWIADSVAVVFDTPSGPDFGLDGGGTASSASAATTHASSSTSADSGGAGSAQATAQTDLTGLSNVLAEADAFSSLFTTLMVTGGTGPVDVVFSFDYSINLSGTTGPGGSFNLTGFAGLTVSDGLTSQFLDALETLAGTGAQSTSVGGTLSTSFLLEYDTLYDLTYVVDVQEETTMVPEPSTLALVAAGAAAAAWRGRRRLSRRHSRV